MSLRERKRHEDTERGTDRDFVLSGEVGPFAQQLALRQGEDAGSLTNQHRVVQATVARSRRDQVPTLNTQTEGHVRAGEKPSAHLFVLMFPYTLITSQER